MFLHTSVCSLSYVCQCSLSLAVADESNHWGGCLCHSMCNVTSRSETKLFFAPILSNFCTKTKQLSSHATLFGRGWGSGAGLVCCLLRCLSILHLFADLVAQDLVPVDLGASHRKLAA